MVEEAVEEPAGWDGGEEKTADKEEALTEVVAEAKAEAAKVERSTQCRTSRSSPGRLHGEGAHHDLPPQSRSERPTPGQSSRTQPSRAHTCPPPSGSCSAPTPAAQKSSPPEAEAQRQKDGWRSQGHCPGRCTKAAEPMATGRREATADRKGMEAEGVGEEIGRAHV